MEYSPSASVELKCLAKCAPLVCEVNDNALAVHRRERCNREHVLGDDVSLEIVETEISLSILSCSSRMCETVNSSARNSLVMPVVKEIIVKECASYKAVLIDADLKCSLEEVRHKETELGN